MAAHKLTVYGTLGGQGAARKLTVYGTLEHARGSPQTNSLRYIRACKGQPEN